MKQPRRTMRFSRKLACRSCNEVGILITFPHSTPAEFNSALHRRVIQARPMPPDFSPFTFHLPLPHRSPTRLLPSAHPNSLPLPAKPFPRSRVSPFDTPLCEDGPEAIVPPLFSPLPPGRSGGGPADGGHGDGIGGAFGRAVGRGH